MARLMTPMEIRAAIVEFLDLLETGRGDEHENWRQLIRVLDRLSWAYHAAETFAEFDDHAPDPPNLPFVEAYVRECELARKRFPDFGFYNQADGLTKDIGVLKAPMVGDAIDDLADIARDLREAVWLWENASERHALYAFRRELGFHTLSHIRHLQVFLLEYPTEQRPEWSTIP